MGEEVAGGGFGGANAYATTVVGQAIKDQTPALTVLGDTEMTIQWEQEFIDPGAVAHDFEDGDLTDEIHRRRRSGGCICLEHTLFVIPLWTLLAIWSPTPEL